jgi:uncharacterized protein YuzE
MKITYNPESDAMRIKFQEGKYEVSEEVGDGIIVDMTKDGKIMAIEMLDISNRMPEESFRDIIIEMPKRKIIAEDS